MKELLAAFFIILGVIFMVMLFGLLLAFPIMWSWNYVIPYLFGLKTITWGQAWCLNFLCGCLIKATQTNSK